MTTTEPKKFGLIADEIVCLKDETATPKCKYGKVKGVGSNTFSVVWEGESKETEYDISDYPNITSVNCFLATPKPSYEELENRIDGLINGLQLGEKLITIYDIILHSHLSDDEIVSAFRKLGSDYIIIKDGIKIMPSEPATQHPTPNMPRRIRVDLFTPAEKAIYYAMQEVEKAGADIRLTDAVNLLHQAQSKVADFVDGIESPKAEKNKIDFTGQGESIMND